MRVVRFYQSCSPHPPPPPPPPFLLLQFLLDHVCINFHVHFRLANLSPISSPTSARSGHCWTSTAGCRSEWARLDLNRKVPSAVGTAGPQPGTFRAQWAPLDFNLGPSELSGHHWTSTWDLPSSVGTAGPQRRDRMPEDMPDKVPECLPDRTPDDLPDRFPDKLSECQKICQIECQKICQNI